MQENESVIIRVFRGQVQPGKQDEFESFLRETAIPEFRAHPGLTALHIGMPTARTPDEFLVTTVWKDLGALQSFAGDRWFEARVAPAEKRLLKKTFVHHYEDTSGSSLEELEGTHGPSPAGPGLSPRAASVLLVAGPSMDVGGIVAALRAHRMSALIVSAAENAIRLVEKWRPQVAVVSADVNGAVALLRHLERRDIPIILIGSEKHLRLPERFKTLEAGILAPAEPEEIAGAAQIVVGRTPLSELPEFIDLGPLRMDMAHRLVHVDGRTVELPPKEFAVLAELAIHAERPVTSAELARRVWPESVWTTADDVRRTVYRLRKLIGDHGRDRPLIRNRRGYGYVLEV